MEYKESWISEHVFSFDIIKQGEHVNVKLMLLT